MTCLFFKLFKPQLKFITFYVVNFFSWFFSENRINRLRNRVSFRIRSDDCKFWRVFSNWDTFRDCFQELLSLFPRYISIKLKWIIISNKCLLFIFLSQNLLLYLCEFPLLFLLSDVLLIFLSKRRQLDLLYYLLLIWFRVKNDFVKSCSQNIFLDSNFIEILRNCPLHIFLFDVWVLQKLFYFLRVQKSINNDILFEFIVSKETFLLQILYFVLYSLLRSCKISFFVFNFVFFQILFVHILFTESCIVNWLTIIATNLNFFDWFQERLLN